MGASPSISGSNDSPCKGTIDAPLYWLGYSAPAIVRNVGIRSITCVKRSDRLPALAIAPGNHDQARIHLVQRWQAPLRNYLEFFGPELDTVHHIAGATLVCLATPRRWTGTPVTFSPSNQTSPLLGFSRPAISRIKVHERVRR